MSEQKALTINDDPIYKMLVSYKGAIASVLPKHLTAEKMLRVSYQMITRTPKLRQCTPASLINGIIEISLLGLDIGRTAHLVPFGKEAVVIPDYKGFIDLAHRSGQINSFPFKPVYENDVFDYQEGTERYIKHKPATTDRGRLIAAYAIVNFKHGGFDFEVVHPVDIEAVKKKAPGAKMKDSPWNDPDQEWTMWCKTAVRRLAKRIPQSPELSKAVELEDLVEAGLKQQLSHIEADIIPITPIEPEPDENPEDLKKDINDRLDGMKGQATPVDDQSSTSAVDEQPNEKSLFGRLKAARSNFCQMVIGNIENIATWYKIEPVEYSDIKAKWRRLSKEPWPIPEITGIAADAPNQDVDEPSGENNGGLWGGRDWEGACDFCKGSLGPVRWDMIVKSQGVTNVNGLGLSQKKKLYDAWNQEMDQE